MAGCINIRCQPQTEAQMTEDAFIEIWPSSVAARRRRNHIRLMMYRADKMRLAAG